MKALVLVKTGAIEKAFELREVAVPEPRENEVLIKVEAFGLNYADGMAIKGQYQDAPPLPSILGYDVCGRIVAIGSKVTNLSSGMRVTAMTRFGGYAEFAVTDARAVVEIDEDTSVTDALSLATQAATAFYCTRLATTIFKEDRVIVTAAAGGVGSLIVQIAKQQGAKVYGIVSTEAKGEIARSVGVDVILNRSKGDVFQQYQSMEGKKAIDIMFDSAGGSYIRKAIGNLAPGGRVVGFGAAQSTHATNIFKMLKFAVSFGLFHPAPFLMKSHSFTGVNMLQLADYKPEVVAQCLHAGVDMYRSGLLKPLPGKVFGVDEVVLAHRHVESGTISGKIAITW